MTPLLPKLCTDSIGTQNEFLIKSTPHIYELYLIYWSLILLFFQEVDVKSMSIFQVWLHIAQTHTEQTHIYIQTPPRDYSGKHHHTDNTYLQIFTQIHGYAFGLIHSAFPVLS